MFGIGLPELILIMALALIVVGPDKLPGLARAMAKHLLELKKTANSLKANFQEEMADMDVERPPGHPSHHQENVALPHVPVGQLEESSDILLENRDSTADLQEVGSKSSPAGESGRKY